MTPHPSSPAPSPCWVSSILSSRFSTPFSNYDWRPSLALTATLGLALTSACVAAPTRDAVHAPASPASPGCTESERALLFEHVTVHTGKGSVVSGASVLVRHGRIEKVLPPASVLPAGEVERVEGAGRHLYPSLVEADATLGLMEVDAVRQTRDLAEAGNFNANARAELAFNPDSQLLPIAMSGGVLIAHVVPRGGLISGTSAVMALDGWNRDDMTLLAPATLAVRWPGMTLRREPDSKPPLKEQLEARAAAVRSLYDYIENARAFEGDRKNLDHERDVAYEALPPFLHGERPVMVTADGVDEIRAAIAWARHEKLKLIVLGGRDADRLTPLLLKQHVGVIYTHTSDLPAHDYDAYDRSFTTPLRLLRAGVPTAISVGASGSQARTLPDLAGRLTAFGLSSEAALATITSTPAQLLGLDSRLGSLEVGKDATFILTDGDILDTRSHVLRAWLAGREVDLKDRQKQLWQKYRQRPTPSGSPVQTSP